MVFERKCLPFFPSFFVSVRPSVSLSLSIQPSVCPSITQSFIPSFLNYPLPCPRRLKTATTQAGSCLELFYWVGADEAARSETKTPQGREEGGLAKIRQMNKTAREREGEAMACDWKGTRAVAVHSNFLIKVNN